MEKKEFAYDLEGNILTNSIGTPELSSYDYYLPKLNELNTYGVILAFLLGAALLFLLDYYDKRRTS